MPSVASLEAELAGYKRYGKKERAAEVEAEIARLTGKKKPAAKKPAAKKPAAKKK